MNDHAPSDPNARLKWLYESWLNLHTDILNTLDQVNVIEQEIKENEQLIRKRREQL